VLVGALRFVRRHASDERGDRLKSALRAVCALALLASSVGAQTFTVVNDNSGGAGSLYQAVLNAASGSTGSLIVFSGTDGNIQLGSELAVSNAPTISAAGTTLFNIPDPVSVSGMLTLDMGGATGAVSGVISDASETTSGALTVKDSAGGGALTLTNSGNTYSGGTAINSGTLSVYGDGALGATTGGITFNGGTLQANGGTGLQSGRTVDLLGGGGTFDANSLTSTLSGLISGGGGLTVLDSSGRGSLTLTNSANTYSGGTTLVSGTLIVSADGDLGAAQGPLTFNGGTLEVSGAGVSLSALRTVMLDSGGGIFDTGSGVSTIAGAVAGAGQFTLTGGGVLTLTDAGNGYQGGTQLNSGTLSVSADGDLGASGTLITFNGGTLQADGLGGATGLTTSRPIFLTGAGGIFDANGLSSTLSGVIGGSGGLTLESSGVGGVLALTNAGNTYSGGTTLNSGTLRVASDLDLGDVDGGITFNGGTLQAGTAGGGTGLSSARSITLAGNGTFDANGLESVLSGPISGGGEFIVMDGVGGGSVELSASNSYTGGTLIESGARLAITNSSALGASLVAFNGGTLQAAGSGIALPNALVLSAAGTLDADGTDISFTGPISGAGLLTLTDSLNGGGQISLQGANTATGGTAIVGTVVVAANAPNVLGAGAVAMTSGGGTATLSVGADQTIGSLSGDANSVVQLVGANLTVGGSGAGTTFAGTLVDDGGSTLTKTGGGVFTLSGSWSVSNAVVSAGTLQLGANAADAGAIQVASGATFDMNGFDQTGSGAVVNNGTLATGAATLKASSYSGSGTLSVNVLSSGPNLQVAGVANVTGQTLIVAGHPATGEYEIVSAGTLTGTFDIPSAGGYAYKPSYVDGDELMLDIIAGTFSQAGQTGNQAAIAAAFNAAVPVATGDLTAVLTQLSGLSPSRQDQALDQLGPISIAAMSGMSDAAAGLQSAALGQRMSGLQSGDFDPDGASLAYFKVSGPAAQNPLLADGIGDSNPWDLSAPSAASFANSPLGFFAAAVDSTGKLDSIAGSAGSQPGYSFGEAGGLVGGDYRFDDQTAAGVFLGYVDGAAQIAGGGSVDEESLRGGVYLTAVREGFRTDLSGGAAYDLFSTSRDISLLSRTATATPKGAEANVDLRISYDLPVGACVVAPFVGGSYDQLTVGGYSESGAGSVDLSVARQRAQSERSDLGARVSRRYELGPIAATPFASLAWGHEYADQSRAIDAELAGGAGGAFAVQTADVARDAALVAAGADIGGRGGWDVRLAYSGDLRGDYVENSVSGSVRLKFDAPGWLP
jgi:autotransporter-associated beta strand protein